MRFGEVVIVFEREPERRGEAKGVVELLGTDSLKPRGQTALDSME